MAHLVCTRRSHRHECVDSRGCDLLLFAERIDSLTRFCYNGSVPSNARSFASLLKPTRLLPNPPDGWQAKETPMRHTRLAPFGLFAALLLLGLLTGCGGSGSSTPVNTGPVTSAPRTVNGLQFTLTADKSVYKVGETVNFTFVVKNIGTQPIPYSASSPVADASVTHGSQVVWQYSHVYSGGLGGFSTMLQPGDTTLTTFPITWKQTYTDGGQVPTGQYALTSWFNPIMLNGTELHPADTQASLYANPIPITIAAQ